MVEFLFRFMKNGIVMVRFPWLLKGGRKIDQQPNNPLMVATFLYIAPRFDENNSKWIAPVVER